jgi:hypothetical protein
MKLSTLNCFLKKDLMTNLKQASSPFHSATFSFSWSGASLLNHESHKNPFADYFIVAFIRPMHVHH